MADPLDGSCTQLSIRECQNDVSAQQALDGPFASGGQNVRSRRIADTAEEDFCAGAATLQCRVDEPGSGSIGDTAQIQDGAVG